MEKTRDAIDFFPFEQGTGSGTYGELVRSLESNITATGRCVVSFTSLVFHVGYHREPTDNLGSTYPSSQSCGTPL
eukprot:2730974-Ditylum_brightwellii.AAC.1